MHWPNKSLNAKLRQTPKKLQSCIEWNKFALFINWPILTNIICYWHTKRRHANINEQKIIICDTMMVLMGPKYKKRAAEFFFFFCWRNTGTKLLCFHSTPFRLRMVFYVYNIFGNFFFWQYDDIVWPLIPYLSHSDVIYTSLGRILHEINISWEFLAVSFSLIIFICSFCFFFFFCYCELIDS